ncbi:MAG: GNAT family N-acetyltransferase [Vulcanimicrobiaceae bacterium]
MLRIDASAVLEPLTDEHVNAYAALVRENGERLARWFAWAEHGGDVADVRAYVAAVETQRARRERNETYAIIVDGAFAGVIGLHDEDVRHDTVEFGYWIGARFGGRGVMTRAVSALGARAFARGLHRLEIIAAVDNAPSRAVAERAGFAFEGIMRGRVRTPRGHEDAALYARLATDP